MDDGPAGWLADPEHEGQERYWDGDDWTDQVRPAVAAGNLHLPEHVPELQRALAAATADIDAIEDRLSSLFDRTGAAGGNPAPAGRRGAVLADVGEATDDDDVILDLHDEDFGSEGGEEDESGEGEPEPHLHGEFEDEDGLEGVSVAEGASDDDDDSLTELDAALAAEVPDEDEADSESFRHRL